MWDKQKSDSHEVVPVHRQPNEPAFSWISVHAGSPMYNFGKTEVASPSVGSLKEPFPFKELPSSTKHVEALVSWRLLLIKLGFMWLNLKKYNNKKITELETGNTNCIQEQTEWVPRNLISLGRHA